MGKLRYLLILCAAVLLTVFPVSAATGISQMSTYATVSSDSSCQVTVTATVHLEQAVDQLIFPVPKDASAVSVNGSRVRAPKNGDFRQVDLSRRVGKTAGDFTFTIQYSLHDVVNYNEAGLLELQLPLLCGFAWQTEAMEFSVTLPGPAENLPGFSSGYHQANIEKDLSFTTDGATVSGTTLKSLKDHETLTMTMMVSEDMFPQSIVENKDFNAGFIAMAICGGIALVYWLLFLSSRPTLPRKGSTLPQGVTAGELGSILGMQGVDLTAQIFAWAQLGYLQIRLGRKGQIRLYKLMDMGNERPQWEQRLFHKVFGKMVSADPYSYSFAALWQKAAKTPGDLREWISQRSGNPVIFRGLLAAIGLFGGAGLGISLAAGAIIQWLVITLFALLGLAAGWLLPTWSAGLYLRKKDSLWTGLWISIGWILLGILCGDLILSLWTVGALLFGGLLLFWGGRRTENGRIARSQILALRRYFLHTNTTVLQQLCQEDPDYFFRMLPAAIALGVDRHFAQRFGSIRFAACPYLKMDVDANMTASQWCAMLRRTAEDLDRRGKSLSRERFLGILYGILKNRK